MRNMYIIPPPHLLKIYDASTASHCQKRTSLYAFGSEFRQCRNIASDITSGIRAVTDKCSTYHFRHGRRCLHAASSLYNKLEVQKYTRTYIFERIFALFSANSLYLHRLFPKGFFYNIQRIYFVASLTGCQYFYPAAQIKIINYFNSS